MEATARAKEETAKVREQYEALRDEHKILRVQYADAEARAASMMKGDAKLDEAKKELDRLRASCSSGKRRVVATFGSAPFASPRQPLAV